MYFCLFASSLSRNVNVQEDRCFLFRKPSSKSLQFLVTTGRARQRGLLLPMRRQRRAVSCKLGLSRLRCLCERCRFPSLACLHSPSKLLSSFARQGCNSYPPRSRGSCSGIFRLFAENPASSTRVPIWVDKLLDFYWLMLWLQIPQTSCCRTSK